MKSHVSTPVAIALRLMIALFVIVVSTPAPASAEPFLRSVANASLLSVTTMASDGDEPVRVSLESTATAVQAGEPFDFTVKIDAADDVPYVETRFRLKRPTGRLIFQRTRIEQNLAAGETVSYPFTRQTADLDLEAGSYPIEVTTRYSYQGEVTELAVEGQMLVFGEGTPAVPVVVVVRVTGQPLAGPSGRFVVDPARYSGARDNVEAVSRLVLDNPQTRMTLAVSPLLLQEWRRISEGFEIASPEGVETVPSTSDVSLEFAQTLQLLRDALETSRLELMSLGFADPNPTELEANGLGDDMVIQHQAGVSAIFASIESTASTGTAPAGGCLPQRLVAPLASTEVSYAVLSPECTRSGDATAATGAYRVDKSALVALVADEAAGTALLSGDPFGLASRAFARYISENNRQPLVVAVDLEAGSADAAALRSGVQTITQSPWMDMALGKERAAVPVGRITVTPGELDEQAPAGYWNDVVAARRWSQALAAALPSGDARAVTAQADALIAECSAWAGPQGDWALAERGRSFATEAVGLSRQVLDRVTLTVPAVTLAGSKGELPVSVTNDTDLTLNVRILVEPSSGIAASLPGEGELELRPQENFIQIPVDLENSLSGRVNVQIIAADVVLAQQMVTVRASILDKIAIVAGIVIALAILLAFIVRRVRSAEPLDDHSQYTEEREEGSVL